MSGLYGSSTGSAEGERGPSYFKRGRYHDRCRHGVAQCGWATRLLDGVKNRTAEDVLGKDVDTRFAYFLVNGVALANPNAVELIGGLLIDVLEHVGVAGVVADAQRNYAAWDFETIFH